MKSLFTILAILLVTQASGQLDTIIQNYNKETRSTPEEVLLKLRIVDDKKQLQKNLKIWIVSKNDGKTYHATTNEKGKAYFLLPNGQSYHLNFKDDEAYKIIKLPPTPYLIRTSTVTYVTRKTFFKERIKNDTVYQEIPLEQYATSNLILAKVQLKNFSNEPLADEVITMSVKGTKEVFVATTDKAGKATWMLPKGKTYFFNLKYFERIDSVHYEIDDDINVSNIDYQYFGSKAIEEREKERERALAERDSLYKIREAAMIKSTASWGENAPLLYTGSRTKALLDEKVEKIRGELEKDDTYFEKVGYSFCATMHRMNKTGDWLRTLIVTDLTGSMTPYMNQVLVWHSLNAIDNEDNQYLFFNDGRVRYRNGARISGGGGLFFTDNNEIGNVINTMNQTKNNYHGGDGPENDIEALMTAMELGEGYGTVILIADNYSAIKDKRKMSDLISLGMPIKIILAGNSSFIHEDYLELAYRTRGSIHTLHEDVSNLMDLKDGRSIRIGGEYYRVNRGRFLKE
ncbi:MAG: hypothetical protein ACPG19_01990 [Saprospiraceae bacterium]